MEDRNTGTDSGSPPQIHLIQSHSMTKRHGEADKVAIVAQQVTEAKFNISNYEKKLRHQESNKNSPFSVKQPSHNKIQSPLKTSDNAKKLFIKPLNKHSSKDTILSAISKFGRVEYLRVPFSSKKRKNLGYGFVVFESLQVTNMLCDHQIKTKIDDKIVGFSRFDVQQYKSKKAILSSCSDSDLGIRNDIEVNNSVTQVRDMLTIPGSEIDQKQHFVKPTKSKYFQLGRDPHRVKYKYNMERLAMKNIRDTLSTVKLVKLTREHVRDH